MVKTSVRTQNTSVPNTREIVLAAIRKLTLNTGWTTRKINELIRLEYNARDRNLSRKVGRALKTGVKRGLFHVVNGRYRLKDGLCHILASPIGARERQSHNRTHALRKITKKKDRWLKKAQKCITIRSD
ncbi:uncharacterized protein LOC123864897 [Maniola jurtina]|uniref:uncharacterized protein LOC123864897 n=1 Tax=Maniola jurtina TaxID=191418 RepID=UPI001E68A16B|nr:uncharacterized protein LOC123864897 [Maniola jurtina]